MPVEDPFANRRPPVQDETVVYVNEENPMVPGEGGIWRPRQPQITIENSDPFMQSTPGAAPPEPEVVQLDWNNDPPQPLQPGNSEEVEKGEGDSRAPLGDLDLGSAPPLLQRLSIGERFKRGLKFIKSLGRAASVGTLAMIEHDSAGSAALADGYQRDLGEQRQKQKEATDGRKTNLVDFSKAYLAKGGHTTEGAYEVLATAAGNARDSLGDPDRALVDKMNDLLEAKGTAAVGEINTLLLNARDKGGVGTTHAHALLHWARTHEVAPAIVQTMAGALPREAADAVYIGLQEMDGAEKQETAPQIVRQDTQPLSPPVSLSESEREEGEDPDLQFSNPAAQPQWQNTVRVRERLQNDPRYEEPPEDGNTIAIHGRYNDRPVIGRDMEVQGGVYLGGGPREAIIVDDQTLPSITYQYDCMYRMLLNKGNVRQYIDGERNMQEVLEDAYEVAMEQLPFDQQGVEAIVNGNEDNEINLATFIQKGVGVCRHQALLVGYLLQRMRREGILPEEDAISVDRNVIPGRGGHAWVYYKDAQGNEYIVDPAQHVKGRLLKEIHNGWNYRRPVTA